MKLDWAFCISHVHFLGIVVFLGKLFELFTHQIFYFNSTSYHTFISVGFCAKEKGTPGSSPICAVIPASEPLV